DDRGSLLSIQSLHASPDSITKLVTRVRALTEELLPVEVTPSSIKEPTSRVITPQVISTYIAAAGDFHEALPYALLRARRDFMYEANHNPADYGENYGRAVACEVLARRVVRLAPPDRLNDIMSTRFSHCEWDGERSDLSTALELAIDTHCTIFLSSVEAQNIVMALWNGDIVQKNNEDHDIDYVIYRENRPMSFLDPSRLAVPKYQNHFKIMVWLFFLVVYSISIREPLDRIDPTNQRIDVPEVILYTLALSFLFEIAVTRSHQHLSQIYKVLRFASWRTFSFWNFVNLLTDALFTTAFVLRVIGLSSTGSTAELAKFRSFQVLSFASPLIWWLITVFDGYKYMGTLQICVARMLRESGIFFGLLSLLAIGFAQGLYALDVADGTSDEASTVLRQYVVLGKLVDSLAFRAPDYDKFKPSPASLALYYLWNVVTALILLNVLISLFASAYSDIVDDAEAEFLTFFATKTIGLIRAPDEFVYPAPFNLVEVFIAPFELCLPRKTYIEINRYIMLVLFFVPVVFVSFFEAVIDPNRNVLLREWAHTSIVFDDSPDAKNPKVTGEDAERGLVISKVPFSELIKEFPKTTMSAEATIVSELGIRTDALNKRMNKIEEKMDLILRLLQEKEK
ncbi:calcium activated cation channel, partial [Thelephora terrestris]